MARKSSLTVFDNMEFPDYEFREFPMMVYSGEGKDLVSKVVDAVEFDGLTPGQWRTHPDPARGKIEAPLKAPPSKT